MNGPVSIDTPLIIACPQCGGQVVSRHQVFPEGMIVCPPPPVTVLCRDCGHVLAKERASDQEQPEPTSWALYGPDEDCTLGEVSPDAGGFGEWLEAQRSER